MACMCGDICCNSCGPAQGNTRCPICRAWTSDGCEHFEEFCVDCGTTVTDDLERGSETCGAHGHEMEYRLKPEFHAEAERLARIELEADVAAEKVAEEYWASLDAEGRPPQ